MKGEKILQEQVLSILLVITHVVRNDADNIFDSL